MHGRELLEAIVTRYPDSFPAVALLANFQHFEGLYEAVGKRWQNGWGSYLFDGQNICINLPLFVSKKNSIDTQ